MSALAALVAAASSPPISERQVRQLALSLSETDLHRARTRGLITAHQYETVLALRGWTAAVPA